MNHFAYVASGFPIFLVMLVCEYLTTLAVILWRGGRGRPRPESGLQQLDSGGGQPVNPSHSPASLCSTLYRAVVGSVGGILARLNPSHSINSPSLSTARILPDEGRGGRGCRAAHLALCSQFTALPVYITLVHFLFVKPVLDTWPLSDEWPTVSPVSHIHIKFACSNTR